MGQKERDASRRLAEDHVALTGAANTSWEVACC
jgi:hypothetical protein